MKKFWWPNVELLSALQEVNLVNNDNGLEIQALKLGLRWENTQ